MIQNGTKYRTIIHNKFQRCQDDKPPEKISSKEIIMYYCPQFYIILYIYMCVLYINTRLTKVQNSDVILNSYIKFNFITDVHVNNDT